MCLCVYVERERGRLREYVGVFACLYELVQLIKIERKRECVIACVCVCEREIECVSEAKRVCE